MRTLFPSRTQALHARLNEADLPDSCEVEVPGPRVSDGEGGTTTPWVALATLPCRVSPISTATERMQAARIQEVGRFVVTFARATVIPLSARLTVQVGDETLVLNPRGSNGPRTFEAQRKYECSLWGSAQEAS